MPGDTNGSSGCRVSNEKGNQIQASEGILPHRAPPIVIGNPSLAAAARYSDRGRISEIGRGGALVLVFVAKRCQCVVESGGVRVLRCEAIRGDEDLGVEASGPGDG
jgi:hypothetical protein